MAITFSTSVNQNSKTAGTTLVFGSINFSNIAIGDLIVVTFASDDTTGTYSCADDQSNSYQTDLTRVINSTHVSIVVFSAIAAISATTVITITHPSLTARAGFAAVFRGASTAASRVDGTPVSATGTGNAGSGNYTSASSGSVMIGLSGYESDVANTYVQDAAFLPNASFKAGTTAGADASNITLTYGYRILTGTATDAYDTTNTVSRSWAAALLAYKSPTVYQPRHPAINHQNPALLFKRWWQGWSRRPSGVLVPA